MNQLPAQPTPDQSAAHEFLAELRTRITTQALPYQYGVETQTLESLWEVFTQAREAMKKYPGCEKFAARVTHLLNVDLRPFTAKWDRAHADGQLNSRDGADEFRGDLIEVQKRLKGHTDELRQMAYGSITQDELSPPAISKEEMDEAFNLPLPFGIPRGTRDLNDEVVADINAAEAKEVKIRRAVYKLRHQEAHDAVGLAFSGGGIRSATFCLGVTQVLAKRNLLQDVDFLSTVSGGGYTGSFLTVRLGTNSPLSDVAGPHGPDPEPISRVRHYAKFLNPVNLKDGWTMVTGVLAGMLLNWTIPLVVIVLAAGTADTFRSQISDAFWGTSLKVCGGLTGLALVAYGGLLNCGKKLRVAGGWLLGVTTAMTFAAFVAWLADKGYNYYLQLTGPEAMDAKEMSLAGISGVLAVALPAINRFFPYLKNPGTRKLVMKFLLGLAGAVIPLLALWFFYQCRKIGDLPGIETAEVWDLSFYGGQGVLVCVAVMLALVALRLINVNLTAPHRIYRERLAKTFIQKTDKGDGPVVLAEVNPCGRAPYHLINTALNLPSSEVPALRDRKCAFFLFSKHWTGSATTGYHRTTEWKTNGNPVDLATAMAVSGAAASSYMGLSSMPTLTALLTFLNIRLGFWIRRPDKKILSEMPGFGCLLREMTGVDMDEKGAWLNLSDGGHVENMGIYELLRRRCKFIICVDGEADPDFTFTGLLTLVRHAQIDYGIRIEPDVRALRPELKTGTSQAHALFCRIHYPETGATGFLLYLKLSVTGNETELINRYRTLHPEFPHEPTADQFFNEEQFEAYRELGAHVAEGLFARALTNGITRPASIAEWFRQLASNLLLPEYPEGTGPRAVEVVYTPPKAEAQVAPASL